MSRQDVPLPDFERCDAFWSRQETDRPLLAAWVGTYEIPKLYPTGLAALPEGQIQPSQIDFEAFRPDYEHLFEQHSQTGSDVPWAAFPVMVVPWVEAIIGCPIYHRDGNVWAGHWLEDYGMVAGGLKINQDWLDVLTDFQRWLVNLSAGRFPVALALMRGPTDLLAAVRDAQNSIFDLYDSPELIDHLLQQLTGIWIDVAHAQGAQIASFAGGYSFSIQNLWSRDRGGWFQDDALAYWSPTFYRKYARACEEQLAGFLPFTGIHLHSPALYTVEDLVAMPDLNVVEVNLDDVGLRIPEMMPWFSKVLGEKCLYVWGAFTTDDLVIMKENLPTAGLALQLMAETPQQVRAMIADVERIWAT